MKSALKSKLLLLLIMLVNSLLILGCVCKPSVLPILPEELTNETAVDITQYGIRLSASCVIR